MMVSVFVRSYFLKVVRWVVVGVRIRKVAFVRRICCMTYDCVWKVASCALRSRRK